MDWLQSNIGPGLIILMLTLWFKFVGNRFKGYDNHLLRIEENQINEGQKIAKVLVKIENMEERIVKNEQSIQKISSEVTAIKLSNPGIVPSAKRKAVLIVDDSGENAKLLQERFILKTQSNPKWKIFTLDIDIANSANSAVKKLNNGKKYHLGLFDIRLGKGMDGWGLRKYCDENETKLIKHNGHPNVILFSADNSIETVDAKQAPWFLGMSRPITTEEFEQFDDMVYTALLKH